MTAGNIDIKRTDSSNPDFRMLITELDIDLRKRNGDVMDVYDEHNNIEQIDTVIIAYLDDIPVGCGCYKSYNNEAIEVKRMFVKKEARGQGISRKILAELEHWAKESGYFYAVLETGNNQTEALALYRKAGYEQIPAYGVYADLPDSVCFRKQLD